jgi:outer membrane protein TolC
VLPCSLAAEERPPEEPSLSPAPLLHGTLDLSLDDAIRMGLENNLDVQVERYSPLIADLDYDAAWGAYDPTLFAELTYTDTKAPNTFAISGVSENVNRATAGYGGVRGILPLASTEFSTQFDGGKATTNSTIQALSPQFDSGWSVDVIQPVLRDLIWNQPWTQVRS